MKSPRILLFIFLIYLLGFFTHAIYLKKTVYGDGIYYYSWLRSAVIDKDLYFTNEYSHFHSDQPLTPHHVPGNKYTVGPALLWLPGYFSIHRLVDGDGYTFPYQFTAGITCVFFVLFGLLLLYRLLLQRFSSTISIVSILSIAFATNLFFYGSLDTVNSHALSFFTTVLFLVFLFQHKRRWVLIGGILGLVGLIRTQDVVLGLLILPYVKPKELPMLLCGLFFGFLPQLVAWQQLYGTFWISPYLNGTEGFRFQPNHIFDVLFAPTNGLFLWTPITLIGCIGLWIKTYRTNKLYRLFFVVFLIEILITASWSSWLQGASYSGRMFVSSLPVLTFGVANFYQWLSRYRFGVMQFLLIFVIPLSTINMFLILFFLITHS